MAGNSGRGWRHTAALSCLAGLFLRALVTAPPVEAAPDAELIWEEGTVTSVSDGDTLVARMDAGPGARGSQRVRTIGVQAPEVSPDECGASQARDRLRSRLPVGSRVQTRSVDVGSSDDYSGGRIVRSLYARDGEGNWFDTSRRTMSDGWMMWFPLAADSSKKPEWAHNLEYRVLAEDAAIERRGLWSADLCGKSPSPAADLRIWAKYWGTEKVYVENRSGFDVDLSGWTLRDSALNYRTLPTGTVVPAGQVREVFSGDLGLNNLPVVNDAFEGDAVYLMDTAGSLETGNLRAWFPYPCNPDNCRDPLVGAVDMELVQVSDPPYTRPSAPGSVKAVATTDGTGAAVVTWAAPVNLGAYSVTYTLEGRAEDGGSPLTPITGITGLSTTVTGLSLGRAYTFTVKAVNSAGAGTASAPTPPVAPTGLPGAPTAPTVALPGTSAVVSWQWPAGLAGEPPVGYSVTATPVPASAWPVRSCATSAGDTSCRLTDLAPGVTYSVTVTATLGGQARTSPATPVTVPGAPVGDPGDPVAPAALQPPTSVLALAGDTRAVIAWTAPDQAATGPIEGYLVSVEPTAGGQPRTCVTAGETSCVVTGLVNGTEYVATVVASVGSQASDPAAPSTHFTPYRPVTARIGGPTPVAPPADIWVGGEKVRITNTSSKSVRLGGYGLWDRYSANEGSTDFARYLFPADQTLAAGGSLLVHFGTAPTTRPAAPEGSSWLWTGATTFINSDAAGDFVELANLNRSPVVCRTTGSATCRGSRPVSAATAPVGLTAVSTASSVTVNWGAPISRGGTPITGYTATAYSVPVGGSPIARCSAGGTARSCTFPAALGRPYYVEVVATNAQGTSGPSWRVQAVPKTVPTAPGKVTVSGTPGGVNVSWLPAGANGATITRYTASAYATGTGGKPVGSCTTSNGAMTSCTITNLDGGTRFHIDVVATNRAGNGAPSSPRIQGTPGPGGAVSTYSKGKVTVRWDPPAAGSTAITGYTAQLYTKSSGGTKVGECSAAAGATSCTTKKMKKRSKYYIDLTMKSAVGAFTAKPRIVTGPPKRASAPTVTSATPSGRQVTIVWSPPTFNGYSYLKGYGARLYSKSKGGSVKARCSAGPTANSCTTTSLKKKGTYFSAVRVKNSKGWSSWSKRVKVVVR